MTSIELLEQIIKVSQALSEAQMRASVIQNALRSAYGIDGVLKSDINQKAIEIIDGVTQLNRKVSLLQQLSNNIQIK
jgi:coenzyme F420-reducing hydrogenase delta subunit